MADKDLRARATEIGLLSEEYDAICDHLGREPNLTELHIYSVMWSEHCSYKNSIVWLKTLPRSGKKLLVEAGEENAGLVDLGNGIGCAFKIESHNHPSAVEPYQGAATGVGGIHRDIFTMGARPIAALNSLRFGNPDLPRTQHLLRGVVKGIGNYGNSFGVPTVGGEVFFDEVYHTNPLVNAMSVGICDVNHTVSATAYGAGNPVYIVGAATGKDGIAGAAFASKDLSENAEEDLPAVQVGDPFQEKLLLEASLEVIKTGALIGMQDMGAAGITCSTSEMSAKGGAGMRIDLSKVPTRQKDMEAWEMLLSESQERMLLVIKKGRTAEVEEIFKRWDVLCEPIGEVTDDGNICFTMGEEVVANIPAESLVLGGGAPVYHREYEEPPYYKEWNTPLNWSSLEDVSDLKATTEAMLALPNIASKRWVYEQYDNMVGLVNTSANEKHSSMVIRIDPTSTKGLCLTVDCNARYVHADPKKGGAIAVCEAARNIACSGGQPSAITNCLNFGNPYNKHVYWQFVNAIQGMGEACSRLDTPVTGGNVSFYNQSSDDGPVYPTPTIGMIGTIDDVREALPMGFQAEGHRVYLLGHSVNDIGSSQYAQHIKGLSISPAPYFDIDEEVRLIEGIQALHRDKLMASANDVSDGGLMIALLESSFEHGIGVNATIDLGDVRKDAFFFGEAQGRVIVSVEDAKVAAFEQKVTELGIPLQNLGLTQGNDVSVNGESIGSVSALHSIYDNGLTARLNG
ncbi:MAG: phosphoribosylformylglycinamidine synthase subunit PurL [Chitinophagales bacterium]